MADAPDGYAAYYSSKLWGLLPSIYRTLDPTIAFTPGQTQGGPLQEIVNRIGNTAAVLRRSIDRLWEDQSIESCDDWVIPYIAAQLATNLVAGMDAREQRLAVANTIYYRARQGTISLLEELAYELTGWEVRAVEMFRRLSRARHGLDAAIASDTAEPTPHGGYADLRSPYRASRAHTAFDEFAHVADLRVGSGPGLWKDLPYGIGNTGWHNIGNVALFIFRLQSVPVSGVTPVPFHADPWRLTFDPTGRRIPLFAAPLDAYDSAWVRRREDQLPAPIDRLLLAAALDSLYGAETTASGTSVPRAIALYQAGTPESVIPVASISANPAEADDKYIVDPEEGLIMVPPGSARPATVAYRYGFSSTIGAGGYDRRQTAGAAPRAATLVISGGGANLTAVASGVVEIADSLTYNAAPSFTIAEGGSLVLRAAQFTRPVVRPTGHVHWTFTGTAAADGTASSLVIDGLLVSGCDIVLAGDFDHVALTTATLDPGDWRGGLGEYAFAVDGRAIFPASLVIVGTVERLTIDRSVVGPVLTASGGSLEELVVRDSVVQAVNPRHAALAIGSGEATLTRSTVLGRSHVHSVEASDSIFAGSLVVADHQRGCVRYSAFGPHSELPRHHACVEIEDPPRLFASTSFGHPEYAALLPSIDRRVRTGAETGSEMGAFSTENNPIKERSLFLKYQESMPIGLTPVFVYVT